MITRPNRGVNFPTGDTENNIILTEILTLHNSEKKICPNILYTVMACAVCFNRFLLKKSIALTLMLIKSKHWIDQCGYGSQQTCHHFLPCDVITWWHPGWFPQPHWSVQYLLLINMYSKYNSFFNRNLITALWGLHLLMPYTCECWLLGVGVGDVTGSSYMRSVLSPFILIIQSLLTVRVPSLSLRYQKRIWSL